MYFDFRLWLMTAGMRAGMLGGTALGLLALLCGIARYVFLGQLLVRVMDGTPWQDWVWPAVGVALAVLARAWLDDRRTVQANRCAASIQQALRLRLYDRVVALGPAWLTGQRTGDIMLRMVDGVEQLQTFFGQYLPQLAISIVAPFAIFAVIAFWDLPTASVLLAGALVSLFGPATVHRLDRRTALERAQTLKAFGEEFLDGCQGLPTLKSFGQGKAWGKRLALRARALSTNTFRVLAVSVLTRGITDLGIALGSAAAVSLGGWRVYTGQMSMEALLIVLMAGTEIFRPLRDLRAILHQGMLGQSAAAGIHALLDARGEADDDQAPASPARATTQALEPSIEFDAVRFGYAGREPVHRALSFKIAPGERVGIVGPSGAGKSTLVRLLLKEFTLQAGAIRVGGHDIRHVDTSTLLSRIAVVSQDITLFHGSIAENLLMARPDASSTQMRRAAQVANLDDFIMSLPDGYDTQIGERGLQLSGGQRQRLAIARALLRDAPILILDEALSSVDTQNEAIIQQALNRLMAGRTTLILAHRLASVLSTDRCLVLDQGRVVEAGTHTALMAQRGLYYRLMHDQAQRRGRSMLDMSGGEQTSETKEDSGEVLEPAGTQATGIGEARPEAAARAYAASSDPDSASLAEQAKSVSWRDALTTLLALIAPWKGSLALTIVLGLARVSAFIGVGVLSALVVADVRAGEFPSGVVLALLICAPMAALLHWLESWLAHAMAYSLLADMRIKLYDKLERLAPAYLQHRRSGDLVSLATRDVEVVEYFYAHTVAPAIVSIVVPLSVLGFLFYYSWPVALALLPFLLYAMLSPFLRRAHIDGLGGHASRWMGEMSAHLADSIQGLSELRVLQATQRQRARLMEVGSRYCAHRLALLRSLASQHAWFEVAAGLGGLAVAVVAAQQASAGQLPPAMAPLLVLVAVATFLPVSEISQVSRQLADTFAAVQRLHVVSHAQEAVKDGPKSAPLAGRAGMSVTFDGVGFAYAGRSADVLSDLSFTIPAGKVVALVGPSGAGKSTVASLLLRFWDPRQGVIRLDGLDLREMGLDDLRERVALVNQDTYLFNDTLEANIRLARPDASDADLRLAIDRAALSSVVNALPGGIRTRVGERGAQLSGGQRQRVSIARAFLKDAPILVLDEATSHLDTLSESQIREALSSLMRGRTTLIIAHRLSTVRDADLILVLKHGRLAESGSHDELLRHNGVYAELLRLDTVA